MNLKSTKKARYLHYHNLYRKACNLETLDSFGKPKIPNTYQAELMAKFVFNWECLNCGNSTVSTSYSHVAQWNFVRRICQICHFPYSPYPAFRNLSYLTGPPMDWPKIKDETI